MLVSFGKFKGLDSSSIPVEYLEWCAANMSWVYPEIIAELEARSKTCIRCASSLLLVGKGKGKKKWKKPYKNEAAAKRAAENRARDTADKHIVGRDYAAMREQWELAGGDASQCPFGEDYSGPFLDWEGSEPVIRVPSL